MNGHALTGVAIIAGTLALMASNLLYGTPSGMNLLRGVFLVSWVGVAVSLSLWLGSNDGGAI